METTITSVNPIIMSKSFKILIRICSPVFWMFVFIALVSSGTLRAKTQKTPEQVAGAVWQSAIQQYIQSENALPRTWEDLMRVVGSEYYVKLLDKDYNGYRNRYRFLEADKQIIIKLDEGERRVIGMGITTRIPGPNTVNSKDVRSVILSSKTGDVEHATLSETELESAFRKAGAMLSDYTGSGGKWQPEPIAVTPIPSAVKLSSPEEANGGKHPRQPGATAGSSDRKKQEFPLVLLITCLIAGVAVTVAIWRKYRKFI